VTEVVDLDGLRVTLVDTAGLRETSERVESEGVERARRAAAVADLVLIVVDEDEAELVGTKHLVVQNKADLERPSRGVRVSAVTGAGLDDLRRAIIAALDVEPVRDRPALTNVRHIALVQRAHVGLCTLSTDTVAHMPCNPAVGGTAKGHLVREIDAIGGLMGRAIDATGIQFKLLNRSRGPAVWSPRAQADKTMYGRWVEHALDAEANVEWLIGKAGRILVSGERVVGLALEGADEYACEALVMTTGTFLNGLIHIGPDQHAAGRAGEPPSRELAESLKSLGFEW